MRRRTQRIGVPLSMCAALLVVMLSACAVASSSSPHAVTVTVRPQTSLADQAVQIRATGLAAGEQATLQMSSTDATGVHWLASAAYRADAAGNVDLSRAPAISGSYRGISGVGLIWSMHPTGPDPAGAYFWANTAPLTFTVTVSVHGNRVASTSFHRMFSRTALADQTESLQADGFVGEFWHPTTTSDRRPAILVLGGSEGGLPGVLLPAMLASAGYPALGVAYFGEPGLPKTLSSIPLEYFAKALNWLARQPGVDPTRIAVLGISRGSEAAQLLGVYYPRLVHAVIASVPSNVALCSYPGCTGPAWTLNGQALPYTSDFDVPAPTDDPAAIIPDQRIQGPVFLDCGEADQTWISCPFARAILSLLDAHHDHWTHVLYAYARAGHPVGILVPDEPEARAYAGQDPSYAADREADALLWPHLLHFLAGLAASPAG
jgi:dienelactone hydrolase